MLATAIVTSDGYFANALIGNWPATDLAKCFVLAQEMGVRILPTAYAPMLRDPVD